MLVSPAWSYIADLCMQTLVSVSTIGTQDQLSDEQLAEEVKAELGPWFGAGRVEAWKLLRVYRVPFAQPNQVWPDMLCICMLCDLPHLASAAAETHSKQRTVSQYTIVAGASYRLAAAGEGRTRAVRCWRPPGLCDLRRCAVMTDTTQTSASCPAQSHGRCCVQDSTP